MTYKRHYINTLKHRINEPRRFIQVISGPRQVGKTTLVRQFLSMYEHDFVYESADAVIEEPGSWITSVWERGRARFHAGGSRELLLCFDEIQKIPDWSEFVKREWEKDSSNNINIKLILLGSSRLLLMEGLNESLAGRFESITMSHWKYVEMKEAFGFTPAEYVWFGAYPGATDLRTQEERFKNYVRDALIETAISKDIFLMKRINKPVLLKRLFELSVLYSGQIISYTKLLGQLQDAGNTVTLAHYLDLIDMARLVCGLEKFSSQKFRQRASSPKLQVYNTALASSLSTESFSSVQSDTELWGRYVESAIGAHLLAYSLEAGYQVLYWRDKNREVDFVLQKGKQVIAIEVKSGRKRTEKGLEAFRKQFSHAKTIIIGSDAYPWQDFLLSNPSAMF